MSFPRWRYHKKLKPEGIIVQTLEQNEALGAGWVDSPAEFEQDAPAVVAEAIVAQAEAEKLSVDELHSGDAPKVEKVAPIVVPKPAKHRGWRK